MKLVAQLEELETQMTVRPVHELAMCLARG